MPVFCYNKNMKVLQADVLGFCFGVRRAVDLALKALEEQSQNQNQHDVYSLGPLIHNESVLEKLANKGLKILDEKDIDSIAQDSVVIIRAHGVSPSVFNQLKQKKCQIVDATCTRVKASQKMVEKHSDQNDFIFLSGDNNHGEVRGIAGYAKENFRLIQNADEAQKMDFSSVEGKNIILISQTTFSIEEFNQIESILRKKFPEITVKNTICPATNERQQSLMQLCKKVDGVLVIGGKSSANTKRLYQIALENCKNAALIQGKDDIPEAFFNLETVGITAGASTPDDIISSVCKELSFN